MLSLIDKKALLEKIRERAEAQLEGLMHSQRKTQEGATHAETRAEDPKDTRATEASYLARGLAERAEQLRTELDRLLAFEPGPFGPEDPIGPGALIRIEEEGGEATVYFLLPVQGGESVPIGEASVSVLSPLSPIGRALLGREMGDEFAVVLPRGETNFVIEEVS